jgi:hypothetical protein
MKKNRQLPLRKVRPLNGLANDIYYTSNSWETKEIEGVTFIYVIKNIGIRETPKLMRKDAMEYLK